MYTDKEIEDVFESMKLLSEEERSVFRITEQLEQESNETKYWVKVASDSCEEGE